MPWCKFFVPKIASSGLRPDDPELNEHIEYAKCIKGHVLKDASDWLLCENLPSPDARCWQEGGETLIAAAPQRFQRDGAQAPSRSQRADDAVTRHS